MWAVFNLADLRVSEWFEDMEDAINAMAFYSIAPRYYVAYIPDGDV